MEKMIQVEKKQNDVLTILVLIKETFFLSAV